MEPNSDINPSQPTMPPPPAPITPPVPPVSPVIPASKPTRNVFVWVIGGIIILGVVTAIVIGLVLWKYPPKQITSYEECVKAKGSYIQESNPPTCVTSKGLNFKEVTSPVTQSSESETSPFSDLASNWKTFNDPEGIFSFKYPMNLTDLKDQGGVSGPWTGNPQSIINLGDSATIHWGTDAPYNGFSVYMISKLVSVSLLDYLSKEVETAKNSPRGIKSSVITETSLGGQIAAFIDNTVIHREYFIPSPDGKKIVVFSRINSTDSFLDTFDQILSTFKFVDQNVAQ